MLFSHYTDFGLEAGCDEAGRGCLAGAVFAAAVILPQDLQHPLLNDSKKLSEKQREKLRLWIEENARAYAVAQVSPQEIDEINILQASILAMHRAIDGLKIRPDYLLIDGNRFKNYQDIPHTCMVKGDARFSSIAAASILAKTYRDDYMKALHQEYPYYAWDKNKAYATQAHYEGIEAYGLSPYHRHSFRLARQLKIF